MGQVGLDKVNVFKFFEELSLLFATTIINIFMEQFSYKQMIMHFSM